MPMINRAAEIYYFPMVNAIACWVRHRIPGITSNHSYKIANSVLVDLKIRIKWEIEELKKSNLKGK